MKFDRRVLIQALSETKLCIVLFQYKRRNTRFLGLDK